MHTKEVITHLLDESVSDLRSSLQSVVRGRTITVDSEGETYLEDKPADRTPGDPGPAAVADDVALRTLVDRGPGGLETDGALQLLLHVEPLVHGGGPGQGAGTGLRLSRLAALLPLSLPLFHLGEKQAELLTVFLHCFLPE